MQFTATVEEGENGWLIGQANELPAAMSQGKSLEDLQENLIDAIELILEEKHFNCTISFNRI